MNDDNGDLNTQANQPDQLPVDDTNNAFAQDPESSAADAQLQPSDDEIAPDDPVDILDSEPSTRSVEPNPQPFADGPKASLNDPVVEPTPVDQPASLDSVPAEPPVEPVTPEATQTADQPAAPAVAAAAPASTKSGKVKKQKQPKQPKLTKPPKQPKQPKQPKNRSRKSPASKIILTAALSILLLAVIAAALWFFVFQPEQSDQLVDDTANQQSAQTVERTPENSAELAIEAIQTGLHEDLDDLYEEMVITPSTPDSSDAILSPSYQVSGESYSVSTTETYGLVVAPNASQTKDSDDDAPTSTAVIDKNFVNQVDETSTTILTTNNYVQKENDDKFGTIYESADVICAVMTASMPNQIVCVNKSAYKTASDDLKLFATAFLAENDQPSVDASFKNDIDVSASQTENYEIAEVGMANAVGLFYRQLGEDWHFFTGTQQILECKAFDTEPVQAAFAGEKCLDASADNPTNKPTTVAEYFAKTDS